mgnify:CR=1 FL=1
MSTVNHNLKNNTAPVGFFDSGVGGLSVYSRFKKLLPAENTIYYGDLAHLPYGNKTKDELVGFAREILDFYKSKAVKAVVIACNTSSAQAYDVVKDEYDFKIYPIIQCCAKIIASRNLNKIGVFATQATVNAHAYRRELQKYNPSLEVEEIACPNWVPIVEEGRINTEEAYLDISSHLNEMLKFNPDKVILGCTHYPYLLSVLQKMAPDLFIDPAEIFVDYIKNDLELNSSNENGSEQIFVSANPDKFIRNAKIFYEVKECSIPLMPA